MHASARGVARLRDWRCPVSRALLAKLAEELVEELVPVGISALRGLAQGKPPEAVLSQAERDVLARVGQKRLDDALAGKPPVPGTGE